MIRVILLYRQICMPKTMNVVTAYLIKQFNAALCMWIATKLTSNYIQNAALAQLDSRICAAITTLCYLLTACLIFTYVIIVGMYKVNTENNVMQVKLRFVILGTKIFKSKLISLFMCLFTCTLSQNNQNYWFRLCLFLFSYKIFFY